MSRYTIRGFKYEEESPMARLQEIEDKIEDGVLVEVKYGDWEILTDEYDCEYAKCSCCGEELYDANEDTIDITWKYCPNCGAKMRKEQTDGKAD